MNLFLDAAYGEANESVRPSEDLTAAERLFRVIGDRHLDRGKSGRRPELARNEMFRRLGETYVEQFNDPAERKRRRLTRGGKRDAYRGHEFVKRVASFIDPHLEDKHKASGIRAAANLLSWQKSQGLKLDK